MHSDLERCPWADPKNVAYVRYHDEEWGVPKRDDRALFELLTLEIFQAGLSWATILGKREGFRRAFSAFDVERVAQFRERDVERLLLDASIVRNRAKIEATVANARAAIALERGGGLGAFVWSFVGDAPIVNAPRSPGDVPAKTATSQELGEALRGRGFRFVGPTVTYAFMQSAGLVDDHLTSCFRKNAARTASG